MCVCVCVCVCARLPVMVGMGRSTCRRTFRRQLSPSTVGPGTPSDVFKLSQLPRRYLIVGKKAYLVMVTVLKVVVQ